jgi:general stress protein 26
VIFRPFLAVRLGIIVALGTCMTAQTDRERLHEIIRGFTTAMFVTRMGDETLHARPMSVASVDESGEIWFTTGIDSGKVSEMLHDRHVAVVMQGRTQYLSISGKAQVFSDVERAKQLWSEAWRPWFPQGPEDPELVLVKVTPGMAEYWDLSGIKGVRYVFEAVKHVLKGQRMTGAPMDHHRKLDLASGADEAEIQFPPAV